MTYIGIKEKNRIMERFIKTEKIESREQAEILANIISDRTTSLEIEEEVFYGKLLRVFERVFAENGERVFYIIRGRKLREYNELRKEFRERKMDRQEDYLVLFWDVFSHIDDLRDNLKYSVEIIDYLLGIEESEETREEEEIEEPEETETEEEEEGEELG